MTPAIKALFVDMDGVLWRDLQPIGNLKAIFAEIHDLGLNIAFITNNATRTKHHYVEILKGFSVTAQESQIYTSAYTTAKTLKARWPEGGSVYIIGDDGLHKALAESGFEPSTEDALAVIVGLDHNIAYEKLAKATLLLHQGVPFYGTNPDRTLPSPRGLLPGAGALIAAIETASDIKAHIIGKPQPEMLLNALNDLELEPQEALMVGDRLETDIAAGQAAGCQTALVLSGASSKNDLEQWPTKPDFIGTDLANILEQIA